jgi:hypothetical protein
VARSNVVCVVGEYSRSPWPVPSFSAFASDSRSRGIGGAAERLRHRALRRRGVGGAPAPAWARRSGSERGALS